MNTTITFKTPKKLRDEAKKAAKELGIPLSTYMNAMLSQLVRERTVTLSAYPTPKPEKIAEWNKIGDDMDTHPEKYKVYNGVEEFLAYMNKEWAKADAKRKA
jgi:antitoxin component of RelBE/YafQ-DinJ toxin-antitoxin module